jgi:hypothetical protein
MKERDLAVKMGLRGEALVNEKFNIFKMTQSYISLYKKQ